jgi:hypothetical protein
VCFCSRPLTRSLHCFNCSSLLLPITAFFCLLLKLFIFLVQLVSRPAFQAWRTLEQGGNGPLSSSSSEAAASSASGATGSGVGKGKSVGVGGKTASLGRVGFVGSAARAPYTTLASVQEIPRGRLFLCGQTEPMEVVPQPKSPAFIQVIKKEGESG